MDKIEIKAPFRKQEYLTENDLNELKRINQFFEDRKWTLNDGAINLVLLQGDYMHLRKQMRVTAVLVNERSEDLVGVKFNLELMAIDNQTKFAKGNLEFGASILGVLKPREGVVIRFDVPVGNKPNPNVIYKATELKGSLTNIELSVLKHERMDH